MSEYLSKKLRVLSFVSILAVVFWHGYMMPQPMSRYIYFYLFQNIVTSALLRFSVPLFFIISGFLFFYKPFSYSDRLRKRVKTLLIPYILWSFIGAVFIYSLQLFPVIDAKMNTHWEFTFIDFLKHITINPVQYQFWFLRDLMALALLSPLIYKLSNKYHLFILLLLFMWWLYKGETSSFLRADSLFFFFAGSVISLKFRHLSEFRFRVDLVVTLTVLWVLSSIYTGFSQTYPEVVPPVFGLYQFAILCGLLSVWGLYDLFAGCNWSVRLQNSNVIHSTFFLFCFQEPFLTILKKTGMTLVGSNPGYIGLYFFNTTFVCIFSLLLFLWLNNTFNRVLFSLIGGR